MDCGAGHAAQFARAFIGLRLHCGSGPLQLFRSNVRGANRSKADASGMNRFTYVKDSLQGEAV
jgi:hypothetical protein